MKSVYFIAEIGKACNGDLEYAREIIKRCKEAGANAVRFHHFFLEENVYSDVLKKSLERAWSFKLQLPFFKETLFSEDEYQTILGWCKDLSLDFIATPWDLNSFDLFKRVGVTNYKINSLNAMNIPLVKTILSESKRTYLSTGAMSAAEVKLLIEELSLSNYNVALLHAVIAYPAPVNNINIRAIEILKEYHHEVGYSSNDLSQTSVLIACSLGATVIERHVHIPQNGLDLHKASIDVSRFAEEIVQVGEVQELLARKIKGETRGEMINQEILSKSFVIKENIPKGTRLSEENLALQLPAKGVHAKKWFDIVGQKALTDLKKGEYLYSSGIEGFIPKRNKSSLSRYTPGKRGVVVRFKDIDEMIGDRQIDYVEVHYASGDLKKHDECKEYDLDLIVHLPEYAEGKLLDLSSHDESLRKYSIEVINEVMNRARKLQPLFKKSKGLLKFIVHPGTLTYPGLDRHPHEQYDLFLDSMNQMDTSGLEIIIENMTPFAWFLENDWSPKQGASNAFLDAPDIAHFCKTYNYGMCLDVCHAKLYCNHAGRDFLSYLKIVRPYVKHLHFADCTGIDGEGIQIGDGENQWQDICEVFEDFEYGWTPEIWNGHLDGGEKFYEAHDRLNAQFMYYFEKKKINARKNFAHV